MSGTGGREPEGKLAHGAVGFLETVGQPLGIEGPTAAAYIVPAVAAVYVGSAAPLSFLLGIVVGLFVAYSFAVFARRYATAGSIYGFNTKALGPAYGFVSMWVLLFAYVLLAAAIAPLIANLINTLWPAYGNAIPWPVTALIVMAIALALTYRSISISSGVSAVVETVGILCLIVLGIFVLAKGGHGGDSVSWHPFNPRGIPGSTLAFGIVFAFLAFAGFESAAVLGEESRNPRRTIPRAIYTALLIGGLVTVFASYIQEVGFGSASKLAANPAPLVTLAQEFANPTLGRILTAAAVISAFGAAIGDLNASSRVLFASARDGFISQQLARSHPRFRTPFIALIAVWVIAALVFLPLSGADALAVFGYIGTAATVGIILAYLATVIAATVHFRASLRHRPQEFVIPLLGIPIVGYVLYRDIWPIPPYPLNWWIYAAFGWLVLGIVVIAASPALRRRIRNAEMLRLGTGDETVTTPPQPGSALSADV
jgi:amino acid transporter